MSSSSARTRSIPDPDEDLANWASRIKAMQEQNEADDQAEQRKLEEEIANSRMKRLRRSQMYASRSGTPDLCTSNTKLVLVLLNIYADSRAYSDIRFWAIITGHRLKHLGSLHGQSSSSTRRFEPTHWWTQLQHSVNSPHLHRTRLSCFIYGWKGYRATIKQTNATVGCS
jgi:hypothetical protein